MIYVILSSKKITINYKDEGICKCFITMKLYSFLYSLNFLFFKFLFFYFQYIDKEKKSNQIKLLIYQGSYTFHGVINNIGKGRGYLGNLIRNGDGVG